MPIMYSYNSRFEVEKSLLREVWKNIEQKLLDGDPVLIALSGGKTPVSLYKSLAQKMKSLSESSRKKIIIIQVDERFVPPDQDRSNQRMIKEIFPPGIIYEMMPSADTLPTVGQAMIDYEYRLSTLHQGRQISNPTIAILGMGTDGHTASLFPHNDQYAGSLVTDNRVIAVEDHSVPEPRLSLTPSYINGSEYKYLLIYGEEKARVLNQALEADNKLRFPILSVIDDLEVYSDMTLGTG